MTTSAFPFLDGRSPLEHPAVRTERHDRPAMSVLEAVRRWLRRSRYVAAPRDHDPRDESDAYLDRSGLSSVDWRGALARTTQR